MTSGACWIKLNIVYKCSCRLTWAVIKGLCTVGVMSPQRLEVVYLDFFVNPAVNLWWDKWNPERTTLRACWMMGTHQASLCFGGQNGEADKEWERFPYILTWFMYCLNVNNKTGRWEYIAATVSEVEDNGCNEKLHEKQAQTFINQARHNFKADNPRDPSHTV